MACGSGIADCVKKFAQMNGDFSKVDDTGRGCLQRAKHAQGRKQTLANWLTHNVSALPATHCEGRNKEDKRRGAWSSRWRTHTGPVNRRVAKTTKMVAWSESRSRGRR